MTLTAPKKPLLIAALATATALTTIAPANADTLWTSAPAQNVQVSDADFQVIEANYKFRKFSRAKKFGVYSGFGKKKFVTTHSFGKKKKFRGTYSFSKKKLFKKLF